MVDNEVKTPEPTSSGPYRVLALKYRPQVFSEVVGQRTVVRQLQGDIMDNRVGHAYLFTGPRGVGKTSMARIFAKALNCVNGPTPDPCGKCAHCLGIASDSDLDVVEVDAATYTRKEETIELLEGIDRAAFNARNKVYIIDEVHMFSTHSFNVLLKRLEEPPPGVVFILATTNPEKIPETVISRCRRLEFDRMETIAITEKLLEICEREKVEFEDGDQAAVLEAIALASEGGMRDSQVMLDQLISLSEDKISLDAAKQLLGFVESELLYDMLDSLIHRQPVKALKIVQALSEKGRDLHRFAKTFTAYLRDGMLIKAQAPDELLKVSRTDPEKLREILAPVSLPMLLNMVQQFLDLEERMRGAAPTRFLLEFTLMKLTAIQPTFVLDAMDSRSLKEVKGGDGKGPSSASPSASSGEARGRVIAMEHESPESNAPRAMVMHDNALLEELPEIELDETPQAPPFPPDQNMISQFQSSMNDQFPWAGPMLKTSRFLFPSDRLMTVELAHAGSFMKDMFFRPEVEQAIAEKTDQIFGRRLKANFIVAAPLPSGAMIDNPDSDDDFSVDDIRDAEPRIIEMRHEQGKNSSEGAVPAENLSFTEALNKFPDLREIVELVKNHCGAAPALFNGQRIQSR